MTKIIVIGIDGATWNVIDPLISEKKLPIIARLIKNGVRGDLETCIPHVTFPAWKCYSTGKNPGKLGVYWFMMPDIEKKKFIIYNSLFVQS